MKPESSPADLDVYVFGAGASHEHGAPMTDGILPYAFQNRQFLDGGRLHVIARFLRDVFRFDVDGNNDGYPGLVDILSTVDMALDRKESLAPGYDLSVLRRVRDALNYAIFAAIEHSLLYDQKRVTDDLVRKIDLSKAVFISLNYDVIADIALADTLFLNPADTREVALRPYPEPYPARLDYVVEFGNVPQQDKAEQVPLLKLHGSFNWLWSRVTGEVYFGGFRKAIGDIYRYQPGQDSPYPEPLQDLEPILITPTHLKDLRNAHLARVWHAAEAYIRRAGRLTFVGYSLPGDDLHIKYLFKRGIAGRRPGEPPPQITVVDFAKGDDVTPTQQNYQRFFGGTVTYYRRGFKQYVSEMPGS